MNVGVGKVAEGKTQAIPKALEQRPHDRKHPAAIVAFVVAVLEKRKRASLLPRMWSRSETGSDRPGEG